MPSFSKCKNFHGKRQEVYGKRREIQTVGVRSCIAYMLDLFVGFTVGFTYVGCTYMRWRNAHIQFVSMCGDEKINPTCMLPVQPPAASLLKEASAHVYVSNCIRIHILMFLEKVIHQVYCVYCVYLCVFLCYCFNAANSTSASCMPPRTVCTYRKKH